ncbi:hypothetical protein BCI9360_00651 [Bacillus sp. CECT 9360]|nr:hypothetical protein BCI9360_00651 [Bacillus sp. CECT 9360]
MDEFIMKMDKGFRYYDKYTVPTFRFKSKM